MRRAIVKFLQKTRLNRLAHRVYYRYFHGFKPGQTEVKYALERAFTRAAALEIIPKGDYFEFGLFKGYSFWYAQKTASSLGLNTMRFFGFDSFAGLPNVSDADKSTSDEFYEGQYACSKDKVVDNLLSHGVNWERTFLVEGFFSDSLTHQTKREYFMREAAIALIDCDLYSSTVDVLNFLSDRLMEGSILIFDDWNCFNGNDRKGQRRAFREFLKRNPEVTARPLFSYGLYGQAFVISLEENEAEKSMDGAGFEPATLRM
jgi:O-methyltransferase